MFALKKYALIHPVPPNPDKVLYKISNLIYF